MTQTTEGQQAIEQELEEALERGFSQRAIEALQKQIKDSYQELIYDQLDYDLREGLAPNLAGFVQRMANEAVEQLLRGNVDEMRARLRCSENQWTGRNREHWVINGRLSEHDPMVLRKQIVDAYPDLLKSERILDLEDQVASLVKQVNKLEREKQELWERFRFAAPAAEDE